MWRVGSWQLAEAGPVAGLVPEVGEAAVDAVVEVDVKEGAGEGAQVLGERERRGVVGARELALCVGLGGHAEDEVVGVDHEGEAVEGGVALAGHELGGREGWVGCGRRGCGGLGVVGWVEVGVAVVG